MGYLHEPLRNIPAHAGKTLIFTARNQLSPEHPRARGENAESDGVVDPEPGTSPRTRGKLLIALAAHILGRNIPAHAGKTASRSSRASIRPEHPRARGENAGDIAGAVAAHGTSPRTRGKRRDYRAGDQQGRNIPAHAGKTAH